MSSSAVRLIGFEEDADLDDLFSGFRLLPDYKTFLPDHLIEVLRKQHPNVELQSLELLGVPDCSFGGMPSPDNKDHVIVDTMKIPLELRIILSTNRDDLHELDVTLVLNASDVQSTPQLMSDLFIRSQRELT